MIGKLDSLEIGGENTFRISGTWEGRGPRECIRKRKGQERKDCAVPPSFLPEGFVLWSFMGGFECIASCVFVVGVPVGTVFLVAVFTVPFEPKKYPSILLPT